MKINYEFIIPMGIDISQWRIDICRYDKITSAIYTKIVYFVHLFTYLFSVIDWKVYSHKWHKPIKLFELRKVNL